LQQQVHPVVSRLCDPIAGTDSALVAECLGLDPSSYHHLNANDDEEADGLLGSMAQLTVEERFKVPIACVNVVLQQSVFPGICTLHIYDYLGCSKVGLNLHC
jgi:hypothetical protein